MPVAVLKASLSVLQFVKALEIGFAGLWKDIANSALGKAFGITAPTTASSSGIPGDVTPAGVTHHASGAPGGGGGSGGGWMKTLEKFGAAYLGVRFGPAIVRAVVASPWGRAIGAGAIIGGSVYEMMRHHPYGGAGFAPGIVGGKSKPNGLDTMPSVYQIGQHLGSILGGTLDQDLARDAVDARQSHLSHLVPGAARAAYARGKGPMPAVDPTSYDLTDQGISWLKKEIRDAGTPEKRAKEMELLMKIEANTGVTADAVKGIHQGGPEAIQGLFARAAAYVAEDAYTSMGRG